MQHNHAFQYRVTESQIPEVPNQLITIEAEGDINLPNLVALFESYLKAVGYQLPDGHHLDIVPNEDFQASLESGAPTLDEMIVAERAAQEEDMKIPFEFIKYPTEQLYAYSGGSPKDDTILVPKTAKRKRTKTKLGKLD